VHFAIEVVVRVVILALLLNVDVLDHEQLAGPVEVLVAGRHLGVNILSLSILSPFILVIVDVFNDSAKWLHHVLLARQ